MPSFGQSTERRLILSMVQLTPLPDQKGPMLTGHRLVSGLGLLNELTTNTELLKYSYYE